MPFATSSFLLLLAMASNLVASPVHVLRCWVHGILFKRIKLLLRFQLLVRFGHVNLTSLTGRYPQHELCPSQTG